MEIADNKFQNLKKRLDALHYCHPVTPHSAVLVETLLSDLLSSTQAVERFKQENHTLIDKSKELADSISMYQREVSRLGVENNRLHIEIMSIRESASSSQEKWRASYKKLEGEVSDLKALHEMQKSKFSQVEAERDALKAKLDTLYNKVYNPASQKRLKDSNLPVGKQNSVRKQEFKMTSALGDPETPRGFSRSQQEWAQELQDSDERVQRYQEQVEGLIKSQNSLKEDLKMSQEKLSYRDQEIQRLTDILNSGEFALKVPKRVSKENTEDQIVKLTERLDFVNSEYMRADEELTLARTRLADLGNVHLERDMLTMKLEEATREIERLSELTIGKDNRKFESETRSRN